MVILLQCISGCASNYLEECSRPCRARTRPILSTSSRGLMMTMEMILTRQRHCRRKNILLHQPRAPSAVICLSAAAMRQLLPRPPLLVPLLAVSGAICHLVAIAGPPRKHHPSHHHVCLSMSRAPATYAQVQTSRARKCHRQVLCLALTVQEVHQAATRFCIVRNKECPCALFYVAFYKSKPLQRAKP